MSIGSFVAHGYHRGHVMTRQDGGIYGDIRLYDIGEETLIGAEYVKDGSRQAQPISWHPGLERTLRKLREEGAVSTRPTLRNKQKLGAEKSPPPKRMTQEQREERAQQDSAAIQGGGRPHLRPRLKK